MKLISVFHQRNFRISHSNKWKFWSLLKNYFVLFSWMLCFNYNAFLLIQARISSEIWCSKTLICKAIIAKNSAALIGWDWNIKNFYNVFKGVSIVSIYFKGTWYPQTILLNQSKKYIRFLFLTSQLRYFTTQWYTLAMSPITILYAHTLTLYPINVL